MKRWIKRAFFNVWILGLAPGKPMGNYAVMKLYRKTLRSALWAVVWAILFCVALIPVAILIVK